MSGNSYNRRQARRHPQNNVPGYTGPQVISLALSECIRYPGKPVHVPSADFEAMLAALDAELDSIERELSKNARRRKTVFKFGLYALTVLVWAYVGLTIWERSIS